MIEPDERAKIRKNKIQRMLNRPLWLQIQGSLLKKKQTNKQTNKPTNDSQLLSAC